MRHTGEESSILHGRTMARRNISFGGSCVSSFDRSSMFPVSFLRRFVFLFNNVGAWVSCSTKKLMMATAPAIIASSQKIQRQPAACERKPPMTGPIDGPRRGPRLQIDMAVPRCCKFVTSAIVPAPMAMGAAPTSPAKKRNATSMLMLVARPQATVKMMKSTLPTW